MTSTTPVVYNPSNNAPFMVLPKHVDGYIDLLTLADIHQVLSESGQQDDQMLGDWIKKRYLYEPISVSETGREINTSEGFSQLDRAYRRVRSLTNKAQDKWPFFDRNWKEMPSSTVRNNARGEAAPGVRFPSMTGAPRDSPVTNGHVAHKGKSLLGRLKYFARRLTYRRPGFSCSILVCPVWDQAANPVSAQISSSSTVLFVADT
jgi:hypothetical protein